MGWGWIPSAIDQQSGQPHVENPPDNFSAQDFWRWVREATDWDIFAGNANALANSRAVASRPTWRSAGLPDYYDASGQASAQTLRFAVRLRRSGPEGIVITTRSAGETFFARPHVRLDGREEQQSLFHPYWQARLAPSESPLAQAEAL